MAVRQSLFVLLTLCFVAGLLSLSGGILSVTAILLVDWLTKRTLHYITLSVLGAVFHNVGQLILARFLTSVFLYYYIPVLILSGLVVGIWSPKILTGLLAFLTEKNSVGGLSLLL